MGLERKGGLNGRQVFVRKPYDKQLYKWTPFEDDKKGKKQQGSSKNPFCSAKPNTQGEDWFVTYTYDIVVTTDGVQHRYAYVECDYVK